MVTYRKQTSTLASFHHLVDKLQFCEAAIDERTDLLWVISGHSRRFGRCSLYPQKRTSLSTIVMSAFVPKADINELFNNLVRLHPRRNGLGCE